MRYTHARTLINQTWKWMAITRRMENENAPPCNAIVFAIIPSSSANYMLDTYLPQFVCMCVRGDHLICWSRFIRSCVRRCVLHTHFEYNINVLCSNGFCYVIRTRNHFFQSTSKIAAPISAISTQCSDFNAIIWLNFMIRNELVVLNGELINTCELKQQIFKWTQHSTRNTHHAYVTQTVSICVMRLI